MITHVLLDLDGTLTDPWEGITRCIQHALENLGRPVPAASSLSWCIGPPLRESFSHLLESDDEALLERAVGLYRQRFGEIGIYENRLYPGIDKVLHRMRKQGFTLILATSKPTVYARRILERFRILECFEGVFGSFLDGRFTDKAQLLARILGTLALDPARAIMVGDRIHDIAAGKANGTLTAAVAYGYGTPGEIREAKPDLVFGTVPELSRFFTYTAVDTTTGRSVDLHAAP